MCCCVVGLPLASAATNPHAAAKPLKCTVQYSTPFSGERIRVGVEPQCTGEYSRTDDIMISPVRKNAFVS